MSQRRSSPTGFFSPAEHKLKLSDDVIEDDFISTPDSRIWDLSPMRLGGIQQEQTERTEMKKISPLTLLSPVQIVRAVSQTVTFWRAAVFPI